WGRKRLPEREKKGAGSVVLVNAPPSGRPGSPGLLVFSFLTAPGGAPASFCGQGRQRRCRSERSRVLRPVFPVREVRAGSQTGFRGHRSGICPRRWWIDQLLGDSSRAPAPVRGPGVITGARRGAGVEAGVRSLEPPAVARGIVGASARCGAASPAGTTAPQPWRGAFRNVLRADRGGAQPPEGRDADRPGCSWSVDQSRGLAKVSTFAHCLPAADHAAEVASTAIDPVFSSAGSPVSKLSSSSRPGLCPTKTAVKEVLGKPLIALSRSSAEPWWMRSSNCTVGEAGPCAPANCHLSRVRRAGEQRTTSVPGRFFRSHLPTRGASASPLSAKGR